MIAGNFNLQLTAAAAGEWLRELESRLTYSLGLREGRVRIRFHDPEFNAIEAAWEAYQSESERDNPNRKQEVLRVWQLLSSRDCASDCTTDFFCTVNIEGLIEPLQLRGVTAKHVTVAADFRHGPHVGILTFTGIPEDIMAEGAPNTPGQDREQDTHKKIAYTGTPPAFKTGKVELNWNHSTQPTSAHPQENSAVSRRYEDMPELAPRKLELENPDEEVAKNEEMLSSAKKCISDVIKKSNDRLMENVRILTGASMAQDADLLSQEDLKRLTVPMLRTIARNELDGYSPTKYRIKADLLDALVARGVTVAALDSDMLSKIGRGFSFTMAASTDYIEYYSPASILEQPSKAQISEAKEGSNAAMAVRNGKIKPAVSPASTVVDASTNDSLPSNMDITSLPKLIQLRSVLLGLLLGFFLLLVVEWFAGHLGVSVF